MDDKARAVAVGQAKIAEQAERYTEMVKFMNDIIAMDPTGDVLTQEERNLISVGYKNMMSQRRQAWRTADQQRAHTESQDPNNPDLALYQQYKEMITAEISAVITKVMEEVVTKFTAEGPQQAKKPENRVFFHKMEGDYYRYGAETTEGTKREEYKELAKQAYDKATIASQGYDDFEALPPTNPILLGLGLNQSVFYYEICEEHEKAKGLAQKHFESALGVLEQLSENDYKDSTLIMQLLKDNLTLWSEGDGDEDVQVENLDD